MRCVNVVEEQGVGVLELLCAVSRAECRVSSCVEIYADLGSCSFTGLTLYRCILTDELYDKLRCHHF
jgi:hypothetical protein